MKHAIKERIIEFLAVRKINPDVKVNIQINALEDYLSVI